MAVTDESKIAVLYATLAEFLPCITSYLMAADDIKCDGLPCSLSFLEEAHCVQNDQENLDRSIG